MSLLNEYFPRLNASANTFYRTLRLYFKNRSIKGWKQLFRHFILKICRSNPPVFIQIGITYKCQCHCIHCYANAPKEEKRKELDLDEIKSIIDQAKKMGLLQVMFTGGEPLIKKDISEMVKYAHEAGLITRINSNGLLLDRKYVLQLKKAGLTQCHVSIDSANSQIHDRLRGFNGAYIKAVEGIKNLKKFGILCQILTIASRPNITSGLEKIIALGKKLGVMCTYIVFPVASGRYDHSPSQLITEKEKQKVRNLQDIIHVHLELPTPQTECCVTSKSAFFISPYGDFTPCPPIPFVIGNIRKHSLSYLWDQHCSKLNLNYKGYCPMNNPYSRQALKRHVELAAKGLK